MFNIRDYGAVGDGMQLDSPVIQAAVDACAAAGGGTVFVPAGKYLCGTVHLKSHIHILIEKGAYLLGSTNLADFVPREENPANCEYQDPSHSYYHFSLFHADNQEDIAITGFGEIDMQSADGAIVEGITISNMTLRNVGNPILIQVVNRARGPKPECEKIGQIRNIILSDIIITGPYPETFQATRAQFAWTHIDQDLTLKGIRHPLLIAGQPDSPIQNVTMSNVVFRAHGGGTVEDRDIQLKEVRDDYPGSTVFGNKFPTYGLYALNADNLKLYNVEFTTEYPDARDEMISKNVTNFKRVWYE